MLDIMETATALLNEAFGLSKDGCERRDGAEHSNGATYNDGLVAVCAPGRVNLIGEHTDYNDGFVMPIALANSTTCVARRSPGNSSVCRIVSSLDKNDVVEFNLHNFRETEVPGADKSWGRYVKGVVNQYLDEISRSARCWGADDASSAAEFIGFEAAFVSDVPLCSGLSSSASLEVCTAIMLEAFYKITSVDSKQRAIRAMHAEHEYAGVPCGLMDQMVSSCATLGSAMLLDCRSREIKSVALESRKASVVVCNSNRKRELVSGEYASRVAQCNDTVKLINKKFFPVDGKKRTHLRDCLISELDELQQSGLSDEQTLALKRSRHVILENERTLQAFDAAQHHDYATFGKLMKESHDSLRKLYEVSIPEIDFLVDIANSQPGVYGSRITGGGFGGCTVTLVEPETTETLIKVLTESYVQQFGIDCTCYAVSIGEGAKVLWDNR